MHTCSKGPRDCPHLPGKGWARGPPRPRLPKVSEAHPPVTRTRKAARDSERVSSRQELALAYLGGAPGPTGITSGGTRPAGQRLDSGASGARSPRPRRRPQPQANAAEPGRAKAGNQLSRQQSGRTPFPEEVTSPGLGWEVELSEVGVSREVFPESFVFAAVLPWRPLTNDSRGFRPIDQSAQVQTVQL